MKLYLLIALCTIGCLCQVPAQDSPPYSAQQISRMLDGYRDVYRLEKAYLHVDKPYYILGETIWFAAYLRDEYSLEPSWISKTLYVDLVDPDGKIIESLSLYMDSTHCQGNFNLDLDGVHGRYRIRAYTSWMRNYGEVYFFEKEMMVYPLMADEGTGKVSPSGRPTTTPSPSVGQAIPVSSDIQFFPEGGATVLKLESRVGVKMVAPDGRGKAFEATLYDSTGTEVLTFAGNQFGMGSFRYTPLYLSGYYVKVANGQASEAEKTYWLPASQAEGITLSVRNFEDKEASVAIAYSSPALNQGGTLLIVSRKEIVGTVQLAANKGNRELSIPLTNMRDGIVRFTLFDHQNRPVAERILFSYQHLDIQATLNSPQFNKRQQVTLTLSLTDQEGQPRRGKASVAVVDNQLVEVEDKPFNIVSELLLDPEIRGTVESPAWYFWGYDAKKREAIDLLMLTQGWRKYQWIQRLTEFPDRVLYIPESGITISGGTRGLFNEDKLIKTQVTMVSTSGPLQYGEVITSDSGKFTFTGMVFFDSVSLVFQAYKYNIKRKKATGNRNVSLSLFERRPPRVVSLRREQQAMGTSAKELAEYVLERKKIEQIKRTFDPQSYLLDTVAITAKAKTRFETTQASRADVLYRVELDSVLGGLEGSVWDYLNLDPETARIIRGLGQTGQNVVVDEEGNVELEDITNFLPIWLDGFQLTEQDAQSILIASIESIEILLSADVATTQGTENGAVMLYSRTGKGLQNLVLRGINGLKHPGFYVAKEFYQPVYQPEAAPTQRPDRRVTLHWEPVVYLGEDGEANLSFFTDDKPTTYTIHIEGISDDGRPFTKMLEFSNE